jgi:hypothetical protein
MVSPLDPNSEKISPGIIAKGKTLLYLS